MRGVTYFLESFAPGQAFVKGQGQSEGFYVSKNKAFAGFQFGREHFPNVAFAVFDNAGLLLWGTKK
jgi:hypothetical protein